MAKQKILITGGTKGIGLEIAKIYDASNFEVIVCASSDKSINQMKQNLPQIHSYKCDLGNKNEVLDFTKLVNEKHGALDILVNNAGKFVPAKMLEEEDSVFEEQMHLNLFGTYYLTKRLVPNMISEKKGTIFNICSIASIKAYPSGGSYAISKHALYGFSRSLREELKEKNIRVVAVLPGATYTSSWEGVDLPEERFIPASDIAKIIFNTSTLSPQTVIEDIVIRPQLGDI